MWESRREWEQLASGASEPARAWTPWHSYSFLLPHHQQAAGQPGRGHRRHITMQQQSWEPHCVPLLTNLPELWKHPLKNNAYPPKSKLLAIC